jgi:hypothetical protein
VFDASSFNFRVIVPQEAVFDRIPVSHAISLFDMDRQFADVTTVTETVAYLRGVGASRTTTAAPGSASAREASGA